MGKQLNNLISSVWNITTQSNMYFYKGDLSPAYRGQFVFNLQPVQGEKTFDMSNVVQEFVNKAKQ